MRTSRPVRGLANRGLKPGEGESPNAGKAQENLQEARPATHSYTAQTAFRDPKTGRRIPVTIGVVVSDGYIMTWLKA